MAKPNKTSPKEKKKRWLIQCPGCEKDITKADTRQDDAAYVLGRIWHLKHLFCMICKAPVTVSGCRACPQDGCSPICIDCYMETQHPCCEACNLPLRESCVMAMRKKYHHECFRCYSCRGAMPNREYYLLNGNPYDEDCYHNVKYVLRCNDNR
uniref:LIM zinc-binding domain-containing protein n=1 Tax=Haemonchus contortus TaxID=6289 RepID=A0A7I4YBL1_HAECO